MIRDDHWEQRNIHPPKKKLKPGRQYSPGYSPFTWGAPIHRHWVCTVCEELPWWRKHPPNWRVRHDPNAPWRAEQRRRRHDDQYHA